MQAAAELVEKLPVADSGPQDVDSKAGPKALRPGVPWCSLPRL